MVTENLPIQEVEKKERFPLVRELVRRKVEAINEADLRQVYIRTIGSPSPVTLEARGLDHKIAIWEILSGESADDYSDDKLIDAINKLNEGDLEENGVPFIEQFVSKFKPEVTESDVDRQFDVELEELGEGLKKLYQKVKDSNPNSIVFLDKSARNLYFLFKQYCIKFYPELNLGKVRFINVGNEKTENLDDLVRDKELKRLRGDGLGERALVVDEFSASGKSLRTTKQLLEHYNPKTEVETVDIFEREPFWYFGNSEDDLWRNGVVDEDGIDGIDRLPEYREGNLAAISAGKALKDIKDLGTFLEDKIEEINSKKEADMAKFWELRKEMKELVKLLPRELVELDQI